MSNQDKNFEIELLKEEYLQLQKIVEEFDGKALTIKAWSVTFSSAAILTAYIQKAPIVILIAAISSLLFWLIEAFWKVNQNSFYDRIYEIENHFKDSKKNPIQPFSIASTWRKSWISKKRDRYVFKVLAWPHVFLPHAFISISGILLYFFVPV